MRWGHATGFELLNDRVRRAHRLAPEDVSSGSHKHQLGGVRVASLAVRQGKPPVVRVAEVQEVRDGLRVIGLLIAQHGNHFTLWTEAELVVGNEVSCVLYAWSKVPGHNQMQLAYKYTCCRKEKQHPPTPLPPKTNKREHDLATISSKSS